MYDSYRLDAYSTIRMLQALLTVGYVHILDCFATLIEPSFARVDVQHACIAFSILDLWQAGRSDAATERVTTADRSYCRWIRRRVSSHL